MTAFIIKIIEGNKSEMFFDNADGYPSYICEMFDYEYCKTFEGALRMCEIFYKITDKKGYCIDYYYEFTINEKKIDIFDYNGQFIESYKCKNI